jgi:hypothetical protein
MLGVWTSIPVSEGGLEFNSLEIALFFGAWGVYLFPYYKLVWPRITGWKGSDGKHARIWYVIRLGILLDVLHFCSYPFLNAVVQYNRYLMWGLLQIVTIAGVIALNSYYSAVQMIINKSVVPAINGSINGLITTALAIGKAVGMCCFFIVLFIYRPFGNILFGYCVIYYKFFWETFCLF